MLVSLKEGLLDPQGKAVQEALPTLGWSNVTEVRVGKHIELLVEAESRGPGLARPGERDGHRVPVEPRDRGLRDPGLGRRGSGARAEDRPRIGVVVFPGSLDDRDALRAVGFMGGEPVRVWHAEGDLGDVDGRDPPRRVLLRRLPAEPGFRLDSLR